MPTDPETLTAPSLTFYDLAPDTGNRTAEILAGLTAPQKVLSPKYLYDHRGSQLFEQITQLPEYYPTRTELALFERYGADMAAAIGADAAILELGSGNATKIRLLLEHLHPQAYVSIDISKEFLRASGEDLVEAFPWLDVHLLCLDYTSPWTLPEALQDLNLAAFYPGSTIGNFEPDRALAFLSDLRHKVAPRGWLLIGVDLRKDPVILNAAYNDAQGVTAEFNLNLLSHINRLANADFDLNHFRHVAFYDEQLGRIEMHLEASCAHEVTVAGHRVSFVEGERIHTENSYKYTLDGFRDLAARAGFSTLDVWTDERDYFSVHLLRGGT